MILHCGSYSVASKCEILLVIALKSTDKSRRNSIFFVI